MNVLITCPPMLQAIDRFRARCQELGLQITTPTVLQQMTEEELCVLVPKFDGWIIGDDPVTARVLAAGEAGRLRAGVRWGVGMDNVDQEACRRTGIEIVNTPGMFGREVADNAMAYVTMLARQLHVNHAATQRGDWVKPAGISLAGKTVGLVGLGDIGRNAVRRFQAAEMYVIGYDPAVTEGQLPSGIDMAQWPDRVGEVDFLVFACSLTLSSRQMLNAEVLRQCQPGVRIVNVARGPLIVEEDLARAMKTGQVEAVALDVFEVEPLPLDSKLRAFGDRCVWGSHNCSNTIEGVNRTSFRALELLAEMLRRSAR